MSISGCEKRPSLVTAVTVLSNVLPSLSDPAFLRYQKVPLGQFRPELSDHQASDHTRRDPQIQIQIQEFPASRNRSVRNRERFVEKTWRHSPAMTVHRLQGDGQNRPITAISRQMAFEPNQPYVAVSRATGRGALYLLSFDRSMVATYPLVAEYYQRLRYLNQEALREPVDHPQR